MYSAHYWNQKLALKIINAFHDLQKKYLWVKFSCQNKISDIFKLFIHKMSPMELLRHISLMTYFIQSLQRDKFGCFYQCLKISIWEC